MALIKRPVQLVFVEKRPTSFQLVAKTKNFLRFGQRSNTLSSAPTTDRANSIFVALGSMRVGSKFLELLN